MRYKTRGHTERRQRRNWCYWNSDSTCGRLTTPFGVAILYRSEARTYPMASVWAVIDGCRFTQSFRPCPTSRGLAIMAGRLMRKWAGIVARRKKEPNA